MNNGFLGTQASLAADIVLLLEIAMGAGLLCGAWLARAKRYRQHAWCQSTIVILNLAIIALSMAPSFRLQVLPRIPAKLSKPYFALATAHAALGSITELAALYILLAVGTRFLPEGFRIERYKLWMRTVLALWWVVLFLGFATYARWYVPNLPRQICQSRIATQGSTIRISTVPAYPPCRSYRSDSTYVIETH